jgi:predicted amidohydrolase YtcJ
MTELILFNANVITMNPYYPRAKAVCVKDGKILAVGENENLKQNIKTNMKTIDCGGHTILPGSIDAHCHLFAFIDGKRIQATSGC